MTTWATLTEVADITKVTVDQDQLDQAQAVIDIYSNRTMDASGGMRTRDLIHLKHALAWQAVWQSQQFGFTARNQMTKMGQDGLTVTYTNANSTTLSPLAARALKNLSWKASRTLRVPNVEVPTGFGNLIDYSLEASDDLHDWEPL